MNTLPTVELKRYFGVYSGLLLELTDPDNDNANFNPVGSKLLVFFKNRASDPDTAAVIQKGTDAGNVTLANPAKVDLFPGDFAALSPDVTYEFAVKAINLTTGLPRIVCRGSIIFDREVVDGSAITIPTITLSPFALVAVVNLFSVTGIASAVADATKLAGYATLAGYPVGTSVVVNLAVDVPDGNGGTYAGVATVVFQLLDSNHADDAPLWVRPYDYADGTNECVWRLRSIAIDTIPAAWNATTGKFHYIAVVGDAAAVALVPDQVGLSLPV